MILFLLEQKIIEIKESNAGSIKKYFVTKKGVPIIINDKTSSPKKKMKTKKTKSNLNTSSLILFFYPELKTFLDEKVQKSIEDKLKKIDSKIDFENLDQFNKKRHKGENDSYICSLIREDSVEEFIAHVNRKNISLSAKIKPSIYETNSFLIKNEPTLIEYAAFFGSIQIIQYLKYYKVPLTPSLWIYAIHSKNAELIHFLEENKVKPEQNKKAKKEPFEDVFIESIKCHHNDIALYIKDSLFKKNTDLNEYITSFIFRYHNYRYFPNEIIGNDFYYLCQFDYLEIIKILQNENKIDKKDIISTKTISTSIFLMKLQFNVLLKKTNMILSIY